LLVIYLRWHDETDPDVVTRRFGFVVSKKVSKAANDRNRVKRRLREICRLHGGEWRVGFDAVFVTRTASVTASYADLETAVRQLMRRSGCEVTARS
jgi:ribonuclease P protein component